MTVDPLPLYLAENLDKLDDIVRTLVVGNVTKLDGLCRAAERLFERASSPNVHNDEERQYVYYARFIKLVSSIGTVHNDEQFIQLRFSRQLMRANDRVAVLKSSLRQRYALKSRDTIDKSIKPTSDAEPKDEKAAFVFPGQYINAEELYKAFQEGIKIVVWDARSAEDYAKSHIKGIENINIPSAVIKRGYSAHILGQEIPEESSKVYKNRGDYTYIVLMDWRTTHGTFALSNLQDLHQIITIWDAVSYQNKPVILDGGYLEWLDKYPTYSTDSSVYSNYYYDDLDELLTLDGIIYPSGMLIDHDEEEQADITKSIGELERIVGGENELLSMYAELEKMANNEIQSDTIETDFDNLQLKTWQYAARNDEDHEVFVKLYKKLDNKIHHNAELLQKVDELKNAYEELLNKRQNETIRLQDLKLKQPEKRKEPSGDIPSEVKPQKPKINRELKPDIAKTVPVPKPISRIPTIDRKTKPIYREERFIDLLTDNKNMICKGLTGLYNIHNTCYQNTLVQCLRHIPLIAMYFLKKKYVQLRSVSVIKELGVVINKLWYSNESYIRSQEFFERVSTLDPSYGKGSHEDIHQFFLSLIQALVEDTKRKLTIPENASPAGKYLYSQLDWCTSFFSENFFHQLLMQRLCLKCDQRSIRYDMENVFMLSIPQHMENKPFRLTDLMNIYLAGESRQQICRKCKIPTELKRKLVKYPKVAVICIKRYKFLGNNTWEKNEQPCEFAERLRIGEAEYKLHAVALHIGTMTKGHYTAICLNPVDNKWYDFNDSMVSQASSICTQDLYRKAYLLFYEALTNKLDADEITM